MIKRDPKNGGSRIEGKKEVEQREMVLKISLVGTHRKEGGLTVSNNHNWGEKPLVINE